MFHLDVTGYCSKPVPFQGLTMLECKAEEVFNNTDQILDPDYTLFDNRNNQCRDLANSMRRMHFYYSLRMMSVFFLFAVNPVRSSVQSEIWEEYG